ncbi:NUDIX hydrolase [Candidatus Woesearchaeota archaeon]|nr:NUDIX hydrolase [Candidatus Woesearchaeota archaeon]
MAIPKNAKKVFQGIMFDVYQWEQEQFNGTTKTFEAIKRKESVQIIATKNNKIILLEEEQPFTGKFLALPGGVCETNNPEEDAKRELQEETGLTTKKFKLWKKTRFSTKIEWNTYYYTAKNCEKTHQTQLDAGEKITVHELNFEEFIKKVISEEFRNKEFKYMILQMMHEHKLEEFKQQIF